MSAAVADTVAKVTEVLKGTEDADEEIPDSGYRASDYVFLGVFCVLGIFGVVSILSRPKPDR